ncbi:MAG TPA: hypothetical protein VKK79_19340 [Candidatus Lokiarchaeia archaeon]|nr:hypothetical protein [Candidatus Lokiarchaeia archaeon]
MSPDLLSQPNGIGPAFRDFITSNCCPEVAVDLTLSSKFGKKITKYADKVTNLLIVTLNEGDGQQPIESNVHILSVKEFVGPKWLNLCSRAQAKIKHDLKLTRDALWDGPSSLSYKKLLEIGQKKWRECDREIKAKISQRQYEFAVKAAVAHDFSGEFARRELTEHANYARYAGHEHYANSIEAMVGAIDAISKKRVIRAGVFQEKGSKVDRLESFKEVDKHARKLIENIMDVRRQEQEISYEDIVDSEEVLKKFPQKPQEKILPAKKQVEISLADLFIPKPPRELSPLSERKNIAQKRREGIGVLPPDWLEKDVPLTPKVKELEHRETKGIADVRRQNESKERTFQIEQSRSIDHFKEMSKYREFKENEKEKKSRETPPQRNEVPREGGHRHIL